MNPMWIWLVAALILLYLLTFATPKQHEQQRKKEPHQQLGEIDNRYIELFDDDDELLEEFLIIDLLDEEEEEEI